MRILLAISLTFIFSSCHSQTPCADLPAHFSSYNDAVEAVQSAEFQINESVNTSKSSWIRSAHYYSCDGETGYFIFTTDNNTYIHANMPIEVWNGFKNADSFGSYYDENIKGNYQIALE
jgi:hypothetical protein